MTVVLQVAPEGPVLEVAVVAVVLVSIVLAWIMVRRTLRGEL